MESTKERICNLFQNLVIVFRPFQKLQLNCVNVYCPGGLSLATGDKPFAPKLELANQQAGLILIMH